MHEKTFLFKKIFQPEEFWRHIATSILDWSKPFTTVMDCDMKNGYFSWFPDGKLNASVNCVDRHAAQTPDKIALIWEKDEPGQEVKITYKELSDMVNKIANLLKDQGGVSKGQVVAIYMPVSPMAVASMLACSRIGAIHSVIFAGFSAKAISSRHGY